MKKMLPWLITILLAITLIAVVSIVVFDSLLGSDLKETKTAEKKTLTADERVEVTSEITDIKRNLLDPDYVVVVSFAFQLDSKKAKADFDKVKDIQIRPIINRTLADMTAEELNGSKGQDALGAKLLQSINEVLPSGKVVKVDITNFFLTQL
ncbi:flagellar basal body-associated FliL family protein [Paenibacillus cisolokensis]|jgi:flagellar FliL protein